MEIGTIVAGGGGDEIIESIREFSLSGAIDHKLERYSPMTFIDATPPKDPDPDGDAIKAFWSVYRDDDDWLCELIRRVSAKNVAEEVGLLPRRRFRTLAKIFLNLPTESERWQVETSVRLGLYGNPTEERIKENDLVIKQFKLGVTTLKGYFESRNKRWWHRLFPSQLKKPPTQPPTGGATIDQCQTEDDDFLLTPLHEALEDNDGKEES